MDTALASPFKNICFVHTGADGDTNAFEQALRLCERVRAVLGVVSVANDPAGGLLRFLADCGVSFGGGPEQDRVAAVERLVEIGRSRDLETHGAVLRGPASLAIIRHALKRKHDLVVKSAQALNVIQHVLFGHLDRELIRECPCPVWIAKANQADRTQRILAAVDPAPFRDEEGEGAIHDELNTAILEVAAALARVEQAALHVVHVWEFALEGPLLNRAGLSQSEVDALGESIKARHKQALDTVLAPFSEQIARVHLLKGEPADEIARLVASEPFDLVVMGTIRRTGIDGLFMGNTAETVLNQIACSIVAIKPQGFVSPVRAD